MANANRPKLAVIVNSYGAISHGDCICTKLLEGLEFDDHFEPPRCKVAAIHLLEIAKDDIGVGLAEKRKGSIAMTAISPVNRIAAIFARDSTRESRAIQIAAASAAIASSSDEK